MKKIFQENARSCLSACVASITGLKKVPNFCKEGREYNWLRNTKRWLARRGYSIKMISDKKDINPKRYVIAGVDPEVSIIGIFCHGVVMRGGKVIHDPGRKKIKKRYKFEYGIEVVRKA